MQISQSTPGPSTSRCKSTASCHPEWNQGSRPCSRRFFTAFRMTYQVLFLEIRRQLSSWAKDPRPQSGRFFTAFRMTNQGWILALRRFRKSLRLLGVGERSVKISGEGISPKPSQGLPEAAELTYIRGIAGRSACGLPARLYGAIRTPLPVWAHCAGRLSALRGPDRGW
jgi:hypothetical protein